MLICPYSSGSSSLITWSIYYNKWAAKSIQLETEKNFFLSVTQSTSCQMFIQPVATFARSRSTDFGHLKTVFVSTQSRQINNHISLLCSVCLFKRKQNLFDDVSSQHFQVTGIVESWRWIYLTLRISNYCMRPMFKNEQISRSFALFKSLLSYQTDQCFNLILAFIHWLFIL